MTAPAAIWRHQFDDLRPDTTPAITPDELILIARENHIVIVCPGGMILQEVQLPAGHSPRGIQTYGNRVYFGIDALDGQVIIQGLTTKKYSQRKLESVLGTQSPEPQQRYHT
ncbi:hypothetical protein RSOL_391330 [Rhizoctonia solani AG-3 Rhs1AP]|uniref:Uncharacterized protein n=1 Tax=Rhizoctonia solani AG-3 Rhs1AP TaxID=1086054 RepID=X8JC63_9AGAM|nr:hypothetical protein RSOL_391330 [Rhizoctonia solani AG-3 Rhs1AP]